jgi:glutathione-regulated potassium-efflux system ancillary protein KefF
MQQASSWADMAYILVGCADAGLATQCGMPAQPPPPLPPDHPANQPADLPAGLPANPQATPPRVLVLAAHPSLHASRINRPLMDAARALPHVQLRDLYALYPDYAIDVAAEQAALEAADLIVWQHPLHWYSMPPLMKLWLDEVLAFGWAYGGGAAEGAGGAPGQRLRGKDLWLVVSTGGTEAAYHPQGYNRYFFDAFLPPYEQTAALCGMRFLPPLVLHGAHHVSGEEQAAHTQTYVQRLSSYPRWPEIAEMGDCPACTVPADDRPAANDPSA